MPRFPAVGPVPRPWLSGRYGNLLANRLPGKVRPSGCSTSLIISALSGGTFTAGYYALNGDQIFHDFEYRFLRKDWDSELRSRILWSPSNWIRLWSPYFGRTHILSELLDEALFEGKTYGDLLRRRQRPFLTIHATDMATLSRFEFSQTQFDWLCSDLSQLPIARASAASAALPLVLSPVSYTNYAGTCGFDVPTAEAESALRRGGIAAQRAREYLSYLDANGPLSICWTGACRTIWHSEPCWKEAPS